MFRLKQFTLLIGDMLTMYIGLYLALLLRNLKSPHWSTTLIAPMSFLFLLAAIIIFIVGLYDITKAKNSRAFFQKIIISALVWIGLGVLYFYTRQQADVSPKTILLLTAIIGFGLLALWRFLYNKFISTNIWQLNIIFAGVTNEVKELIKIIAKEPQRGYVVSGIIADDATDKNEFPSIIFGDNIAEINAKNPSRPANLIVLSPHLSSKDDLLKDLYESLFQQITILNLEEFYEGIINRIPPFTFSEGWFVAHLQEQQKKVYDRFRILIDYLIALLIGIFFIITFPFIALAIKLNSKGSVFFCQNRTGRLGIPFKVYKYRTMKALAADGSAETFGPQYAADNDTRITTVGLLLRRTRLDEIPQFLNILKGQMSIVGPRPERPEFVEQLTEKMPYYSLRHLIKPGLTGWAQVHKAYYGTLEENLEKLEYDLFYIKNRGPILDISIILRTLNIIFKMGGR